MLVVEEKEDLELFSPADRPSDALYAHLLGVDDVEVVLYFKIIDNDNWEIGLRASHSSVIDVGKISATLGGGGHRKAAGATVSGSLKELQAKIISIIEASF